MTFLAAAAAGKLAGGGGGGTRLATPGAVIFVVGVVLMWWGSGVFRGEGSKPNKQISLNPDGSISHIPKGGVTTREAGGSGGGAQRT